MDGTTTNAAELAQRDRILAGRTSVREPTVSIKVGFGPDIPIFPNVAVMSRVRCGDKTCDRTGACTVHCTCVDCIAIPIPIGGRKMTTQEEIDYLKALKTKGAEPMSISTKTPGGFDLRGQFTAATVAAVMARDTEVRPQPARAPTKVTGQFDARFGHPVAVHKLFPDAGRDDFSDDRSNVADDDTTEHSNLGMAADLINCEISGESGPGCGHNGVDHVARAIDCLTNYARDDAVRKKNLADAGRMHSIRFVA